MNGSEIATSCYFGISTIIDIILGRRMLLARPRGRSPLPQHLDSRSKPKGSTFTMIATPEMPSPISVGDDEPLDLLPNRRTDPLAQDEMDDKAVVTTERRLVRLAIIAAQTGSRFAREAVGYDPVAWLLSPRHAFDGRRAIDACQDRDPFLRATILHSLSLGLDADPVELDCLLGPGGDEMEDGDGQEDGRPSGEHGGPDDFVRRSQPPEPPRDRRSGMKGPSRRREQSARRRHPEGSRRLYTCSIRREVSGGQLNAFCAMVVTGEAEFRTRLAVRYGGETAESAYVREGFDQYDPIALALVSESLADTLAIAASMPDAPIAIGVDIALEQRFKP